MDNALVLIAEDEGAIADVLVAYVEREGMRAVHASDGQVALDQHAALRPDIVLLDIKLPKRDGFEVLAELRRRGDTPVIMVTALGDDLDKLTALRVGADDYIVKPFNTLEVIARVRTVLRRVESAGRSGPRRVAGLEISLEEHAIHVMLGEGRKALDLTLTEFRLIAHMARAPRRAFTRAELVDACITGADAADRTVDSHVSNIRRKILAAGGRAIMEGVRGIGYRLEPLE
jgi:two-component system response regulator AdeR